MKTVFVIDRQQDWPFELPGSTVVTARSYVADAASGTDADARVVNLCRADRYQGRGYYVSLLAEARGHRPLPDVKTIEDLKAQAKREALAGALDALVQQTLHHDTTDRFELDAYFGRDPAELHPALAQQLFLQVQAPLLRAQFRRAEGRWTLDKVSAIGLADVPAQHRAFLLEATKAFITEAEMARAPRTGGGAPKVAILWDPNEEHKPSNEEALHRFVEAAPSVGLAAELIGPDALDRLPSSRRRRCRSGSAGRRSPRTSSRGVPRRSGSRWSTIPNRSCAAPTRSTCAN